MAKGDGRGGARPGAGRKTLKTEREVKEELQKQLPESYEAISDSLKGKEERKREKMRSAWKVVDKFAPDSLPVRVTGDEDKPVGIVVLPSLKNEKEADSKKNDTE